MFPRRGIVLSNPEKESNDYQSCAPWLSAKHRRECAGMKR